MKPLSEILPATAAISMQLQHPQPMQPHGSIRGAGELTTQALSPLPQGQSPLLESKHGLPQPSKSTLKTAQREPREVEDFTTALSQACALLKAYGKTPAELRDLRNGFLSFLPEFTVAEIKQALLQHVNQSDEIPTPRQIREIINPTPPEWKPDWAAYIAIKQKFRDSVYVTPDQRAYLRRCEDYAVQRSQVLPAIPQGEDAE